MVSNYAPIFYAWGVIILLHSISIWIRKRRKLSIIILINIFYGIIYGFTPASLLNYAKAHHITSYNDIDFTDGNSFILFLLSSIVVYIFINIGYLTNLKSQPVNITHLNFRRIRIPISIIMIIGFVGLHLWTRVYGGPIGILPYANDLRAGRDVGINNPWSFMMKLCPFMQLSAYLFFSTYLSKRKLFDLTMFIIAAIGSFLYILGNSSRMHFALFFLILVLIYQGHRRLTIKTYCILGGLAIVSLYIMHIGESLMNVLQQPDYKYEIESKVSIGGMLREEFFFPVSSFQTFLSSKGESFRFFKDVANGLFAWLPSRFKPSSLESLEITNTLLKNGTTEYGGLPTDMVTTCLYELHFIGLFLLPYIYGVLMKYFECKFSSLTYIDFYKVVYYLVCFYFIKAIGYADPANIMGNIFALFWGYVFIVLYLKSKKSYAK